MFNARLKEALFEAKIENATQGLQLVASDREVARLMELSERLERERAASALEASELRTKNAVLLERLDLLANHLPAAPTQSFSTLSEETEDADYALRAGLIDRDEYEAILAAAGALNTEITFDSDSLTRL